MGNKQPTFERAGFKDLAGKRFERLTVIAFYSNKPVRWVCQCDCGQITVATGSQLRGGHTRSCGCLQKEHASRTGKSAATHGRRFTREYQCWVDMRRRCDNPKNASYKNYGAKGITVCNRWQTSFANFFADMGKCPKGFTLDRFPNHEGNYEPGNCRWANQDQQANNKITNRRIEAFGKSHTISEWGRLTGLGKSVIRGRLLRGWTHENAIGKPLRKLTRFLSCPSVTPTQ